MTTTPCSQADAEVRENLAGYFCCIADMMGLPRSAALIYHTLFVSSRRLSFADVVEQSGLSKASASTGLKLLQRMRAINNVIVPGDRRTYYTAVHSIRKLIAGFVQETFGSGLEAARELIDSRSYPPGELSPHLARQLEHLRHWHTSTRDLLPLLGTDPASVDPPEDAPEPPLYPKR